MKLRYSGPSLRDLERLREWIAVHNPEAARNTAKRIQQAATYLKRFPLLGVVLDEGKSEIRDIVIENYVLRYKIDANNQIIHILRIWHGKEDLLSRRP